MMAAAKAKLDALRDAMAAYVCISVNAKNMNKDILINKNNSYFTGANKSKIFVNGDFVYKYCEQLNKDNESEKALNFSELVRVSRAWYKATGGEGVGRAISGLFGKLLKGPGGKEADELRANARELLKKNFRPTIAGATNESFRPILNRLQAVYEGVFPNKVAAENNLRLILKDMEDLNLADTKT